LASRNAACDVAAGCKWQSIIDAATPAQRLTFKFLHLPNHMIKHGEDELDAVFATLSDPTRRRVLETLGTAASP
jgi:hypothetical protein